MRRRYTLPAVPILAAALLAFAAHGARAATALDTPTVSLSGTAQSYVALNITAGPSGAPAGFTIEWMKKSDYDAYGWPVDYTGYGYEWCTFDGVPTFNRTSGVSSYNLAPGQTIRVVLGELFDETGVSTDYVTELPSSQQIVYRVHAEGDLTHDPSGYSTNGQLSSTAQTPCTFTPGFWKNHTELWPVTSLLLGTVSYNATQLLQILGQAANGNGLVSLAHLLIAAKLNVAAGALSSSIISTINSADALIGNKVVPPIGNDFIDPTTTETLTQALDKFDNGKDNTITCGNSTTSTQGPTWGRVRALYH